MPQVVAPSTVPMTAEAFGRRSDTAVYWLGNASFLINSRGTLLMIDPVLAAADILFRLLVPLPLRVGDVPRVDALLYSHTDADHLARATAAALEADQRIGPPPVAARLREWGLEPTEVRRGQNFTIGGVHIGVTSADHPWQLLDPARHGPPFGPDDCCGYRLQTPDGSIWYPGDTRLMPTHLEMRKVDLLLLDVSPDEYHLGVEGAAKLANAVRAPRAVAYHYGTYDAPDATHSNGDPEVVRRLLREPEHLRVVAPGEPVILKR